MIRVRIRRRLYPGACRPALTWEDSGVGHTKARGRRLHLGLRAWTRGRRSHRAYSGRAVELGLATFADVAPGASPARVAERLRELLEEIELADRLGLDVFGVGEHHRRDYSVSAPTVALAAAAVRTERIRLSSAVTVLSSADPVRVFEEFATLDLLSGGRAESWLDGIVHRVLPPVSATSSTTTTSCSQRN